jgi:ABC-type Fe3+ transport system permease subunit
MSMYASAVALWFMAIALVLIVVSVRAWFRSRRHAYVVISKTGSIARKQTRTTRTVS